MSIGFPYVLLADDDPEDREFFRAGMWRVYPELGVLPFESGQKLLEFLDGLGDSALPSCIVIDFKMPPLSAPEILGAIGAGTRYHPIPKIVWSTSERQKDIDACLTAGAVRFVVKPITERQMDEFIRSIGFWMAKPVLQRVPGDEIAFRDYPF